MSRIGEIRAALQHPSQFKASHRYWKAVLSTLIVTEQWTDAEYLLQFMPTKYWDCYKWQYERLKKLYPTCAAPDDQNYRDRLLSAIRIAASLTIAHP